MALIVGGVVSVFLSPSLGKFGADAYVILADQVDNVLEDVETVINS